MCIPLYTDIVCQFCSTLTSVSKSTETATTMVVYGLSTASVQRIKHQQEYVFQAALPFHDPRKINAEKGACDLIATLTAVNHNLYLPL